MTEDDKPKENTHKPGEMEERRTEEIKKKNQRKQNKGAQRLLPNYRFHHIAHTHRKNQLTARQ